MVTTVDLWGKDWTSTKHDWTRASGVCILFISIQVTVSVSILANFPSLAPVGSRYPETLCDKAHVSPMIS
jgi:hypothetical protein